MNEIERRAMLGVVGIGALAALSKAGPLNPPGGAVAGTGRTLDEVYNKIPGANGTGDGRIAIPGGSSTVTISSPGSYVLTGDIVLTSNQNGVNVFSSDVTLDLNGYRVQIPFIDGPIAPIQIGSTSANRVRIHNGAVVGGPNGIYGAIVNSVRLEDLIIVGSLRNGISLSNSANRNVLVHRCQVLDYGPSLINPVGILLGGNGHVVRECTVNRSLTTFVGGITGISLTWATSDGRNVVASNTVTCDNSTGPGSGGIKMPGAGVVRDNTVLGYSVPYPSFFVVGGGGGLANDGGGNV